MKIMKSLLIAVGLFCCSFAGNAQKFAMVDMEYILSNIPAYEVAFRVRPRQCMTIINPRCLS